MNGLRQRLADLVLAPLRVTSLPRIDYGEPPGDSGWFGPDSVTWHVTSDWPSELVGGFSGLILGTLHPLVLAGTLQHSDFNADPIGRLARTGAFVAATAWGGSAVADNAVRRVAEKHRRVVGIAPDGRPYRAGDPDLLLWTHVTVYGGFLAGHLRYHPRPIDPGDVDRYWDEVAVVAEKLGARNVPRSQAEVDEYFDRVRPGLVADADALESARWIIGAFKGDSPAVRDATAALVDATRGLVGWSREPPGPLGVLERALVRPATSTAVRTAYGIIASAAVDLVPDWGREMLGLRKQRAVERAALRVAAVTFFTGLRVTVGTTPRELRQAHARCAAAAEDAAPGEAVGS